MSEKLMSVAYHEAGHAVAIITLGYPFEFVTIVPAGSVTGTVGWDSSHVPTGRDLQVIYASGSYCQMRRSFSSAVPWLAIGCAADYRNHEAFLNTLPSLHREKARDEITKLCTALCEKHWQDIESVAAALFREGTLSFDRVRALMSNSTSSLTDELKKLDEEERSLTARIRTMEVQAYRAELKRNVLQYLLR